MRALFVIEAGYAFGMGHLLRCRPLILHFSKKQAKIDIWVRGSPNILEGRSWPSLMKTFHSSEDVPPDNVIDEITRHLEREHYDWTILDGYGLTNQNPYSRLTASGSRLLTLDDTGEHPLHTDILLNQNTEDPALYRDQTNPECRLLLGPRYALIDRQFLAKRRSSTPTDKLKRILISFGGVDRKNRTTRILDLLDKIKEPLSLDVVLGTYYPFDDQNLSCKTSHPIQFHRNVACLAPLMSKADLMISAGGSTIWQACCMGVPLLALQTVDNQEKVIGTLIEHRAALCLDVSNTDHHEAGVAETLFLDRFKRLMNPHLRNELSTNAKKLVDGKGVNRVAAMLENQ